MLNEKTDREGKPVKIPEQIEAAKQSDAILFRYIG
jgi:hypothetical protein